MQYPEEYAIPKEGNRPKAEEPPNPVVSVTEFSHLVGFYSV